jgi:hypothetical protein
MLYPSLKKDKDPKDAKDTKISRKFLLFDGEKNRNFFGVLGVLGVLVLFWLGFY